MDEHLKLLGFKVRDVVTGFQGVVTSISFYLYGCVQAVVTPEVKDGKNGEQYWFDVKRLEAQSVANSISTKAAWSACTRMRTAWRWFHIGRDDRDRRDYHNQRRFMDEHLKLLGFKVRDVVTGFQGVVTSISFDLYGCVQAGRHAGSQRRQERGAVLV